MKQTFPKNKAGKDKTSFFVIGPFCISQSIWLLTGQFCMEMMRFQSYYFQQRTEVLQFCGKGFRFSENSF